MSAALTDKITDVRNSTRPVTAAVTVARLTAGTTLTCNGLSGWPTASKVHFVTYQIDANSNPIAGTQLDCYGIVSGSNITNFTVVDGTDGGNSIGDIVEMLPTAAWAQDLAEALTTSLERTGALKDNVVGLSNLSAAVQTSLGTGMLVSSGRGFAITTSYNQTEYSDTHGADSGGSTESQNGNIIPISGTLRNFYIDPFINSLNGSTVFTLMKNGSATTLTATIAAGVTTITGDTTHTVSISAGDRISLKCNTTGSASGQITYSYCFVIN